MANNETLSKALLAEIRKEAPELVKIENYLSEGADINFQSEEEGYTALMVAVERNNAPLADFLLKNRANPFHENRYQKTASDLVEPGTPLFKLLKNHELLIATQWQDSEKVKNALAQGADINFQGRGGYTAIMIAVKNNSLPMVELLITYNPNFYRQTEDGSNIHTFSSAADRLIRKTLQVRKPLTPEEKEDFFIAINTPYDEDEERFERGRLKMLEERKKHSFTLDQLQFDCIDPPATEEEIQALQDYIGHPLPELYKEICRQFHGGIPDCRYFEDVEGRVREIGYFFRINKGGRSDYTIWDVIKNFNDELGKDCLPFADDSLGLSTFYLKWVNNKVQIWHLLYGELAGEIDEEEYEERGYVHVLINESFNAFLESLYAVEE